MTPHKRSTRATATSGRLASLTTRATVRTTGTVSKATMFHSHSSYLAAAYAYRWAERAGQPGLSSSAIMRRALAVYIKHLENPAIDADAECRALKRGSEDSGVDTLSREAALGRLQADPLPPFIDVLRDPQSAAAFAASEAHVEALIASVLNDPVMRRKATSDARMASQSPAIPSTQPNPLP